MPSGGQLDGGAGRENRPGHLSFETGGVNQHQSSPHGLEPLLNIDELAVYLGVPVSTIYDWRTNGKGVLMRRVWCRGM